MGFWIISGLYESITDPRPFLEKIESDEDSVYFTWTSGLKAPREACAESQTRVKEAPAGRA